MVELVPLALVVLPQFVQNCECSPEHDLVQCCVESIASAGYSSAIVWPAVFQMSTAGQSSNTLRENHVALCSQPEFRQGITLLCMMNFFHLTS